MMNKVGDTFFINGAVEMGQFGLFILIGVVILPILFNDINMGFGLMLPAGFVGGHGTAAAIGSAFANFGWSEALSIGQTFATIGLLFGLLGGILLINFGTKRNYTRLIKNVNELPDDMLTGLINNKKQLPIGYCTINSLSMDTFTWHIILIAMALGGAYLTNEILKVLLPQIAFPLFGLALICSVIIQIILNSLSMESYVDRNIIIHIGSCVTDYLVAFGVASINITVVINWFWPILILTLIGLLYELFVLFFVAKKFFRNYWYERGMYIYGITTGVMSTGVILLRILDPNFKSGVLQDFGFAWIFLSFLDLFLVSISPLLIHLGYGGISGTLFLMAAIFFLALSYKKFGIQKDSGNILRKDEIII